MCEWSGVEHPIPRIMDPKLLFILGFMWIVADVTVFGGQFIFIALQWIE